MLGWMMLPVRQDGYLDYASVERDLRARLNLCGLWGCSEKTRKMLVYQAYWGMVWTWIVLGLSVVVTAWVVW